jgi:hypothetical protein
MNTGILDLKSGDTPVTGYKSLNPAYIRYLRY